MNLQTSKCGNNCTYYDDRNEWQLRTLPMHSRNSKSRQWYNNPQLPQPSYMLVSSVACHSSRIQEAHQEESTTYFSIYHILDWWSSIIYTNPNFHVQFKNSFTSRSEPHGYMTNYKACTEKGPLHVYTTNYTIIVIIISSWECSDACRFPDRLYCTTTKVSTQIHLHICL